MQRDPLAKTFHLKETHYMERQIEVSWSKQSDSDQDYRKDCQKLSPAERLACIQQLRIAFWGDEAATGRLQRLPEYIKQPQG
jgi:hypothetical protein